jgi:short-subunit dehydrogenase
MNRKTRKVTAFQEKYGPWAVVAGASEGIGRAFGLSLAKRGLHLVLIARKEDPLVRLSQELKEEYHIEILPLSLDLSTSSAVERIGNATAGLDVGLVVYNAALADTGPFLDRQPEMLRRLVATNCTGPLLLCRHFGEKMAERGKGGFVLMSSMSGFQGTPYVAAYGASKAFDLVLAEGLWYELKSANVDVLACCPGPTGTPGFNNSLRGQRPPSFLPVLSPEQVAEESLRCLGKRSVLVPAFANRVVSFFIRKLLPRQAAVRITGRSTGRMYGRAFPKDR